MIKGDCIKDPNTEDAVTVTDDKYHFNYDVKNALEKAGYKIGHGKYRMKKGKNDETKGS